MSDAINPQASKPEAGRNPDLPVVGLLWDATHLILQDFANRAKSYELTYLQWRILGELEKKDGWTQSELARQLETDKMKVNRELERLEAAKLIQRSTDSSDARIRRVFRTKALERSFGDMERIIENTYAVAFKGLNTEQRAVLRKTLAQMVSNLQTNAGGGGTVTEASSQKPARKRLGIRLR